MHRMVNFELTINVTGAPFNMAMNLQLFLYVKSIHCSHISFQNSNTQSYVWYGTYSILCHFDKILNQSVIVNFSSKSPQMLGVTPEFQKGKWDKIKGQYIYTHTLLELLLSISRKFAIQRLLLLTLSKPDSLVWIGSVMDFVSLYSSSWRRDMRISETKNVFLHTMMISSFVWMVRMMTLRSKLDQIRSTSITLRLSS